MTKEYVMKRLKLLTEHKGVQTFNYDEASIVLEEIERLEEVEKEHQKLNGELREEIERLNNGLKDIKWYIEKNKTSFSDLYIPASDVVSILVIIDRLLGSESNEC